MKIIKGGGCLCFSADTCTIHSTLSRTCFKSQDNIQTLLEIERTGKDITRLEYEFKRKLIFKGGYSCSKEIQKGEIKFTKT